MTGGSYLFLLLNEAKDEIYHGQLTANYPLEIKVLNHEIKL